MAEKKRAQGTGDKPGAKKWPATPPKAKGKKQEPKQGKAPQKNLFGEEVTEGKLLGKTSVKVTVKKVITNVELRQGDDKYKLIFGEVKGVGDSIEEAVREFKKAYRAAN